MPKNGMAKGTRNTVRPATLFAVVWGMTRRFPAAKPLTRFAVFTTAISATHVQSHKGTVMVGKIFRKQTTTRTKSAMLSSLAPSSLTVSVLLATNPSSVSVALASA